MANLKTYNVNTDISNQELNINSLFEEIDSSSSVDQFKNVLFSRKTNEFIIQGQSILDEVLLDQIIQDHESKTIHKKIRLKYNIYQEDGINYFEKIRADLVILYQSQQKTEVEIYLIEQKLEQTINKIIRGDWMTASNALSAVTVEAPLDQTLYDEISNFITQYIADNY